MRTDSPIAIRREDYRAPPYLVDRVALCFELAPEATEVEATIEFRRNPASSDTTLFLNGERIELLSLTLNGKALPAAQFSQNEAGLSITDLPDSGTLSVRSRCNPQANTSLEGLYITGGTFCTQCEAEGFRCIAFFPDRPDVMARYSVTIRADKLAYPILLANGNLMALRDLPNGRQEAVWDDPFPKPSYLFALVAGDVSVLTDSFTTMSGRNVALEIYAKPHNLDQCTFAMAALKRSMRWDEEAYGREYDLDRFMIYCADDFNFGAMENKGLNIFNAALLLGKRETATDQDFERIEGVVGHEYFHNWSGNRVTCRDWFQLSLKEGFTVLRDQQFSAAMGSPAVTRVGEVNFLRQHQFVVDAGPLSHPVRPDAYVTIDNFYTTTIYEKGAEVVRMLHTLLGPATFRAGTDEYFRANDGKAATCDDFIAAMEKASGRDLTQFSRWYSTPGTPTVRAEGRYDAPAKRYALTLTQSNPKQGEPLLIPVAVGLLDAKGQETHPTRTLELAQSSQSFVFEKVETAPQVSLLRGFSAPVKLEVERSDDTLAFLAAHDTDAVSRWDAFESLKLRAIDAAIQSKPIPAAYFSAVGTLLNDTASDPALIALMLQIPAAHELSTLSPGYAPRTVVAACDAVSAATRASHVEALRGVYERTQPKLDYTFTPTEVARRSLRNAVLRLLCVSDEGGDIALAHNQFHRADNMTDQLAALIALRDSAHPAREEAFERFIDRFHNEPLVVDKWLAVQAESSGRGTIAAVSALMHHKLFDARNPNKLRAVLGGFAARNWMQFHAEDGAGYKFVAQQIVEIDARNPNVAARLMSAFNRWRESELPVQARQKAALKSIRETTGLSENVIELVDKLLGE
jgi:aminopeptidase N